MGRQLQRKLTSALFALAFCLSVAPISAAQQQINTPVWQRQDGWSDQSYYLPMRDGVRLAVSIWFPGGRAPETPAPVVLIQTRYGRAGVFKYGEDGRYQNLREQGYVVAIVDTRGSTSSFGDRLVEIGPEEVRDMDDLIRHFRSRPWSNGQVFATGVSYMADTADFATSSRAGLTGAVIRQSDFDGYLNLFAPGGVANDFMMSIWGGDTVLRDAGRLSDPNSPVDCRLRADDCAQLWPRLQPVDADHDYGLLRAAVSRARHWQPEDYRAAEFRDDRGANGYTMQTSSPVSRLSGIRRQNTPVQYWASWMDAGTADGVLARFNSAPRTPMQVWITANSHTGQHGSDPFFPDDTQPTPSFDAQWASMTEFLGQVARGAQIERQIHYYVLGARSFRTTDVWPPRGVTSTPFYFEDNGALARAPSREIQARDRYEVDFNASTGEATRWTTQIGAPAAYGDRRNSGLLSYTSAPFTQDMELVGQPAVRLFVSSETADPAFFVYLEDVAPDGRVTYLTEGLFRAIHRRERSRRLPHAQTAPAHSFARRDAEPMPVGEIQEVAFTTFPVAALLRVGHRLRVSIAGADVSAFRRYSEGRADAFEIERSAARPSNISVDMRPWSAQ